MKRHVILLIVDGSPYVCKVLSQKLTPLRWRVETAQSGDKLLEKVAKLRPNAILLGTNLPDHSALSLCKLLKDNQSSGTRTPVIFHSEKEDKSDVLEAINAGADNYLVKPASVKSVLSKIYHSMNKGKDIVEGSKEQIKASVIKSLFTPDMDRSKRLDVLMTAASDIKAMPQTVHRVMEILQDKDADVTELAQAIESDPSISAMILKKANSAFYGSGKPVALVKDAIVRIGLNEAESVVLGLSVMNNFDSERKSLGFSRMSYWEHSIATAIFAKTLASRSLLCDSGVAFMAGLLHDIGKIVLDDYATDDFDQALELAYKKQTSLCVAENNIIGLTHNDVGAKLLEQWQFPENIQHVAKYHNALSKAEFKITTETDSHVKTVTLEEIEVSPEELDLTYLISISNELAKAYRFGHGGDEVVDTVSPELVKRVGLEEGLHPKILERVKKEIASFKDTLGLTDDEAKTVSDDTEEELPTIYYIQNADNPINLPKIYLENSNFNVESCSLEQVAELYANKEGMVIYDVIEDVDIQNINEILQPLSKEIPLLILASTELVTAWDEVPKPESAYLIKKPLACNSLVKKINHLLKK